MIQVWLLVVVEAVAGQVAAGMAAVDVLERFEGDVAWAVAGLVDGEGDDQSGNHVGVGGAVGQGGAVAAGVAGDDEGGVVAEETLLDPFDLLLDLGVPPGLGLVGGGKVVQGKGGPVPGIAHVPGGIRVAGGDGAVRGEPLGVGTDDGGVDAG
ncbi:hypothetical protein ABT116_29270 [Streptomyces sp. NPDC002130]|uniref:hypothetical protein n=1 Tax=Streptomyces sp. NPDC002130 TaxID=3155568 RepID=UPI0033281369